MNNLRYTVLSISLVAYFNPISAAQVKICKVPCEPQQCNDTAQINEVPISYADAWQSTEQDWKSLAQIALKFFNVSRTDEPDVQHPFISHEMFEKILNQFNEQADREALPYPTEKLPNNPFIQKITLSPDAKICVMGDIHGSAHALFRNLLRLRALDFINDDFTLNNDSYLIFTGDYIDRGMYSIEVLYTLMSLKLANPNKVFLIRGNHEEESMYERFGFKDEVIAKWGLKEVCNNQFISLSSISSRGFHQLVQTGNTSNQKQPHTLYTDQASIATEMKQREEVLRPKIPVSYIPEIQLNQWKKFSQAFGRNFCKRLPLALFVKCKESWVQFCHGGFLKESQVKLIKWFKDNDKVNALQHSLLENDKDQGFTWADFTNDTSIFRVKNKERMHDGSCKFGPEGTKIMLEEYGLKAIIRGHQHCNYGFKIADDLHVIPLKINNQGVVVMVDGAMQQQVFDYDDLNENGFYMSEIGHSVFTLSMASDTAAANQPYECFSIITTGTAWEDWRLRPYEFFMGDAAQRRGMFLKVLSVRSDNALPDQEIVGGTERDLIAFEFCQ